MTKQTWDEMSPRKRGLVIAAGLGEACLKAAALIDLKHRAAEQVRGPKWLWSVVAFVNFLGPISYFAVGRRWRQIS